jgi:hypothetical protein
MLFAMERDAGERHRTDAHEGDAAIIRLRPLRLLIVSADHRFRAVIEMLVARRECCAFGVSSSDNIAEEIVRERVDVVLVDGPVLLREVAREVALSEAHAPPVGVVLVGEASEPAPAGLHALAKWGDFDDLFAAIVDADRARVRPPEGNLGPLSLARARELG